MSVLVSVPSHSQAPPGVFEYHGLCDGSAAVAIGDTMLVVATDEINALSLYKRGKPAKIASASLHEFLNTQPDDPDQEADLEAATLDGKDVAYWIGSHSTSAKGKPRPTRHVLFAAKIEASESGMKVSYVGTPYRNLIEDLTRIPELKYLKKAARKKPKEKGGLSIEGLSMTPAGGLLIGFRNPVDHKKALVVPLLNPKEVVNNGPAKFGAPIFLSLGGRGIRSMEYSKAHHAYFIIGGPWGEDPGYKLYRWSGSSSEKPQVIQDLDVHRLQPEGIVVREGDPSTIEVLSDDGTKDVDGIPCKEVVDGKQTFRSVTLTVGAPP
jgi:hypothetical protein